MAQVSVIGGGISGLAVAFFLLLKNPSLDIVLYESSERLGGKIWTDKGEGYLCEGGVNGFLDNRPRTLELAKTLGILPLKSNDAARKRFVFSGGKLHRLPESPPSFFSSRLLSIGGRGRVAFEYFVPKLEAEDETLANFARRRLGKEAYEKLIDPMASGIYAGNPENLSLRACFPRVRNLEINYGGLIKGMMNLKRQKKSGGGNQTISAGPGGVLTSFRGGMGEIIDALKKSLNGKIITRQKVISIDRIGDRFNIYFKDGTRAETERIIVATPAYAASEILRNIDSSIARTLAEISYPSLSVVCFGYKLSKVEHLLDGFGFLVPSIEKRRILGTLWDSSIFPSRSPEGSVLLRSMVGGARASELANYSNNALIDIVSEELNHIMGISNSPDFVKIYRHEMAIPQYNVGHLDRVEAIESISFKYPGLYITGNAYRGIGVNDCIENSLRLVEKIVDSI